jgi:hypothetical protein
MHHARAVGFITVGTREGIVTLTGASHSLANSDPSSDRHARALPSVERYGSKLFVHGSFEDVTLVVESIVGCGVDGEETLRGAG